VRAQPAPSRHQLTFELTAQAFGRCNGLFGSFTSSRPLGHQVTGIECPNLWRA